MTKTASFEFLFASAHQAKVIADTLNPEASQHIPKTSVHIGVCDATVELTISSTDSSALRAACNSYLRWMMTAVSVHQLV